MAFAAQKWGMGAVVMGEKMMTGIAKKSAVTICKLDCWVCISLIYSVFMKSMKIQSKYSGNKNDDSFQKNDDTKC